MAVRPDPELKRGVAHIRALTFRTGVKSGHFFGACPPQNRLQRPARTALQLPPERRNPRKKQIPGITQQKKRKHPPVAHHRQHPDPGIQPCQKSNLHRQDEKQQKLDLRKQGRKRKKRSTINQSARLRHQGGKQKIGKDQPEKPGQMKQRRAKHPPRLFQRITHHERHHDEKQSRQNPKDPRPDRTRRGNQKGHRPPNLPRHDPAKVKFQQFPQIRPEPLQDINNAMENRIKPQQAWKCQPPKAFFQTIQKSHAGSLASSHRRDKHRNATCKEYPHPMPD